MRKAGKFLGRLLLVLLIAGVGLWLFGPYEDVAYDTSFDESQLDGGVQAYFDQSEAQVPDIRENNHKRVIWAAEPETKTPLSIVYFHGFSASSEEIRPVPDQVAQALGANLVFTRFTGHGRDGDAMAQGTVPDWMADAAEALAVARRVGEKVMIISTSTGGTLATLALNDAALRKNVAGVVFVSPNFGVNNPAAPLLTWPAGRYWLPLLFGERGGFEPRNEAQARHWSTDYPSIAVFPMAASVQLANAIDHSTIKTPALFYFSLEDKVVVPEATQRIAARWGGPVATVHPEPGPEDDPSRHVIAGDIVSPSQTADSVSVILNWFKGL